MSSEVQAAFEAIWATGAVEEDWEHWPDHLTEDVHYVERVFGTMHGRDRVRAWITDLMAVRADVHAVLNWYIVKGDRVVFDMTNRYHHPDPSQPPIDFAGLTVLQYGGAGLFRYEEDYWDTAGAKAAYEQWSRAVEAFGSKGDPEHLEERETQRKADNYAVLRAGRA